MTTTQQVKEKRGARAHAHEARAERSIEFHANAGKNVNEHEFQAADCPQNSLCQFWGAFMLGPAVNRQPGFRRGTRRAKQGREDQPRWLAGWLAGWLPACLPAWLAAGSGRRLARPG